MAAERDALTESEQEDLPLASVIVCSRNRHGLLSDAVMSVLEGVEVPAEIVIVDQSDHRNEGLAALRSRRNCAVRYEWAASIGASRARNKGIAAVHHELMVFIDDDVRVDKRWLGTIVRAQACVGPRGVVTGRAIPTPDRPGGFQLAVSLDEAPAVYQGRPGKDVLPSLNMALYKSAIEEVGSFDERLGPGTLFPGGGEDNDLGFRLLEAGYSIVHEPGAVVYHREWRSESDYIPMRWRYGLGRGGFYAKHAQLKDQYMLRRVIHDVGSHVLLARAELSHNPRRAIGHLALSAGIVIGFMRWLLAVSRVTPRSRP